MIIKYESHEQNTQVEQSLNNPVVLSIFNSRNEPTQIMKFQLFHILYLLP